ncbi:MAG: GNAT family N-acetyltransferase [Roseovarius sp.]
MIRFREAEEADVAAIVALLADDVLGQGREGADPALYEAAFARMRDEGANHLIVGEDDEGRIVATCQLTFISGLSLRAARRAQVESVRVASHLRGQGVGEAMFEDVKRRARAAGCTLLQLTMNASRREANRFYERIGFVPSHTGFKMTLD